MYASIIYSLTHSSIQIRRYCLFTWFTTLFIILLTFLFLNFFPLQGIRYTLAPRNLLIWFVLFVMQKLEAYYYYPDIRSP